MLVRVLCALLLIATNPPAYAQSELEKRALANAFSFTKKTLSIFFSAFTA